MTDIQLQPREDTLQITETPFNEIDVSTKTIIGVSNLTLDIDDLFNKLNVSPYIQVHKKRGRKPKDAVADPNIGLEEGSIITLKYMDEVRGVDLKKKKKTRSQHKKYFRNALTIVMKIDDKLINFKISKNGKFQITGSKKDSQAEKCIKFIWSNIQSGEYSTPPYIINGTRPEVTFITVMTNIDFNMGFLVNRENLDKHINRLTEFNSLLETSFGYTGVNIKLPFNDYLDLDLKKIYYENDQWNDTTIKYQEYLSSLSLKDQNKEQNKKRYITFLVFQSGNVIMSGMIREYMERYYEIFYDIIRQCKGDIVEKLDK